MITSLGTDLAAPVSTLLMAGSLLLGIFLIGTGLMRMVDIGGGREGTAKDSLFRMMGGAVLSALPFMAMGIGATLFGGNPEGFNPSGITAPDPSACLSTSGSGVPLTCVAKNIANNLAKPATSVLMGLAYLSGLFLIATALHKLATSQGQGHHQEAKVWAPRLLFGGLLTQMPPFIASIARTLGYDTSVVGASGMTQVASPSLSMGGSSSISGDMTELLGHIFVICMMFGVLAVWRGIGKLRGYAEGTEREGVGAGVTHIVGGVLLANAQFTICAVSRTFVGSSFCS